MLKSYNNLIDLQEAFPTKNLALSTWRPAAGHVESSARTVAR